MIYKQQTLISHSLESRNSRSRCQQIPCLVRPCLVHGCISSPGPHLGQGKGLLGVLYKDTDPTTGAPPSSLPRGPSSSHHHLGGQLSAHEFEGSQHSVYRISFITYFPFSHFGSVTTGGNGQTPREMQTWRRGNAYSPRCFTRMCAAATW